MTDLHYADKEPAGSRYYRQTFTKLSEAAEHFKQEPIELLVELGDLIDAAETVEVEQQYLQKINALFASICQKRHYVLGNHCVQTLTKSEFLEGVKQPRSYYSFDQAGVHFVVLDSCFRSDGQPYGRNNFQWTDANIPAEEIQWLKQDLAGNRLPTIVFAHQRLDVEGNHGVKNQADVRKVLEESGNVLAVFQGHSHDNDLKQINDIHYCTLVAMVEGSGEENNGYSVLDVHADGTLCLHGFRKQKKYQWPATES